MKISEKSKTRELKIGILFDDLTIWKKFKVTTLKLDGISVFEFLSEAMEKFIAQSEKK